jgi:hypothetical protein
MTAGGTNLDALVNLPITCFRLAPDLVLIKRHEMSA